MKILEEGDSTVFYFPARVRDALELVDGVRTTIRVECVDGRPALELDVEPGRVDRDVVDGVERTISEGSNRQFSVSIPPALAEAADLVDVELDADVDRDGRSVQLRRRVD